MNGKEKMTNFHLFAFYFQTHSAINNSIMHISQIMHRLSSHFMWYKGAKGRKRYLGHADYAGNHYKWSE